MPFAVVTRDAGAAAPYSAVLAQLGLETIAIPVTRIEIIPNALAPALARRDHVAIAITSPRAADVLATARETAGVELPEVWAVGAATARVLEQRGIVAIVDTAVTDGASLAHAMTTRRALSGRHVLVPRAAEGRPELVQGLAAANAIVDAVDIYRTVPAVDDPAITADLARVPSAAVICVFAPSQVTALDAAVSIQTLSCPFAAIGETTAAAVRAAGAGEVGVADAPTPEGMANAVRAVYPRPR
jgi:uroporphyrinogen-III synthase